MATGIYQIRNIRNGIRYIGSTAKCFFERYGKHIHLLESKKHHSIKLQRAWNKYGAKSFVFEILEECVASNCLRREQHYLNSLLFASDGDGRFDKLGYNICRTAGSRLGTSHSKTTRLKLRKAQLGKKLSKATRAKMSRIRRAMTYGKKPYMNGEKNHQSKLTKNDVITIKVMLKSGYSCAELGRDFGVAKSTISRIKLKQTWSHV